MVLLLMSFFILLFIYFYLKRSTKSELIRNTLFHDSKPHKSTTNVSNFFMFDNKNNENFLSFLMCLLFFMQSLSLLQNNNISGEIPLELGKLSKLQTLDLSNNGFSGIIPESLGHLTNLRYL